jgi:hypothetical protein
MINLYEGFEKDEPYMERNPKFGEFSTSAFPWTYGQEVFWVWKLGSLNELLDENGSLILALE